MVLASPSIADRPASSPDSAARSSSTPDRSRSIAAASGLGALPAISYIRAETGWNLAPANRGACSASSAWSSSSTCRQPRYWSTLDNANTIVSTRSPTVARKFSSPMVNGADASTTNSSAVADAAASPASSPCTESSPPTPGVSTMVSFSRNSTGPSTST